jgi:diaminohydroxyphosphoribosylaminopyrimidine deaminase/5-amino-6-(5-phosphoribosylamino)uracil reductase
VNGGGASILRETGIEVVHHPVDKIEAFYETYDYWTKTQRCWMTGKLALSQDGKTGENLGTRFQITGSTASKYTHLRRKIADVLITSVNTVRVDDPLMNVRLPGTTLKKPIFIIDRKLACSRGYRIFNYAESVGFVHGEAAQRENKDSLLADNTTLIELPEDINKLQLASLSSELGKKGYHEAWCELGPRLFNSFCQGGFFDEVILLRSQKVHFPNDEPNCRLEMVGLEEKYARVFVEDLGEDKKEVWRKKT